MTSHWLFVGIACIGLVSTTVVTNGSSDQETEAVVEVGREAATQDDSHVERKTNVTERVANQDVTLSISQLESIPIVGDVDVRFDEFSRDFSTVIDLTVSLTQQATMLGVNVRRADDTLRSHLDIDSGLGLVVENVVPDSAAAASGLLVDDVLISLDSQKLVNQEQFTTLIRNHQPGDEVTLIYFRAGDRQTAEVVLQAGEVASTEPVDGSEGNWLIEAHPKLTEIHNCQNCHVPPGEYELQLLLEDDDD